MKNQEMEFVWRPNSESLGTDTQIFTHALYAHYSSPSGLNFDVLDNDAPWINNEESKDFNGDTEGAMFAAYLTDKAEHYLTDDIFVLFGDDFRYMDAFKNYHNMDNMIEYMNKHYGDQFFLKYSTPSEYVDAIAAYNVTWPTKYDDMFPYADTPDSYWTGYFSSRANDKQQVRRASSNYHSSNQLIAEKLLDQSKDAEDFQDELLEGSWGLLDDLSILQHHDAVAGTAKQAVADDYAWRLFTGMKKNNEGYFNLIDEKIRKMTGIANQTWVECFKTNSTYVDCPVSNYEDQKKYTMNVAVQNPSTIDMNQAIIAVPNGQYDVKVFNAQSKAFETVNASVSCWDDYAENNVTYKACNIKISHTTKARDFSLFQLTQNDAASLSTNNGTVLEGSKIKDDKFQLVYEGSVKNTSQINFRLINMQTGSSETLDFSMKYWTSYINYFSFITDLCKEFYYRVYGDIFRGYGNNNYKNLKPTKL